MITSIFRKSKPVNLIIVFFLIGLACSIFTFNSAKHSFSSAKVVHMLLCLGISFFSVLILNFVSSKNNLTKHNSFEIVLYGFFLLLIPQTTGSISVMLSNVFLLFSLRRMISLRSQKSVLKKLFDTSFWIAIATLFHPWAILFFILLPIAILLYTENKLRNWLVPLTAIIAVLLIAYCVCFFIDFDLMGYYFNGFLVSFDFTNYNTTPFLIATTLLFSFGLWSSLFYIRSIREKKKSLRPAFNLVMITVVISFLIVILSPNKQGSEFLFMYAPLAIIVSNYIEVINEKWFREVFLSILVLMPFVLLIL
ncbi:hypothetical protein H7U19_08680 [Hyunsoonleella sp. SJ7]|uniref:Beta-carotene 15,15'-monooxygenase n=1 Tax=Hyunsoonleella aquatilis TaxID=2762758 RepID=A0A923H7W3_9FLAO|nr:DUF6427 family protein [Hyunsoonleella aquatilis]MBC3758476.1 hypothetical protein [Hyunsoonleella aquatilis]